MRTATALSLTMGTPQSIPSFWSSSGTQGKRGQNFLLSLPRLTRRREFARGLAGKTIKKQAERGEFPARTGSSSRALFLRLEIKGERGEILVLCSLKAMYPMKNRRNSCPLTPEHFLSLALCDPARRAGQEKFLSRLVLRPLRKQRTRFFPQCSTKKASKRNNYQFYPLRRDKAAVFLSVRCTNSVEDGCFFLRPPCSDEQRTISCPLFSQDRKNRPTEGKRAARPASGRPGGWPAGRPQAKRRGIAKNKSMLAAQLIFKHLLFCHTKQ